MKKKYNINYLQSGKGKYGSEDIISGLLRTIYQLITMLFKIKNKKIDIIHIHTSSWGGFWRFGLFIFLLKIINKKKILHIHGAEFKKFYFSRNIFQKRLIINILESCDSLIVLSNQWKEFFNSIAPKVKKEVVANSVTMPKSKINDSLINIDFSGTINILFLGGLTARKGIIELINVIPIIIAKKAGIRFTIAGFPLSSEKKLLEELKNKSMDPNLKMFVDLKINFPESEKKNLYKTSDIFILQSYDEGLPFTILEAMSFGLPVITTPVGAISEFIEDGKNGFLIQPGDVDALSEKIIYLIEHPEICEMMGKNNIKKIYEEFSHDKMIEKVDKIYKKLLS